MGSGTAASGAGGGEFAGKSFVFTGKLQRFTRESAEEAARKTAVKLLFPLIFCIFPALLVVILAPAMIQVLRTLMDTGGG